MVNRGRLPSSPIQSRVRENTTTYTRTRPSYTKGDMGVVEEGSTSDTDVDLYVHTPSESIVQTDFGERTEASLLATMVPATDLESDDRLTYNGDEYEVQDVVEYPSAAHSVVKVASLVRTQTDAE